MDRKIPWPRIFVEGVVIVASILLAFGIDAWWASLQQDREYQDVLVALTAEFEEISRQIEVQESQTNRINQQAASIVSILRSRTGSVELPVCDLVALIRRPTLDLPGGELDGLLASGDLGLIKDRDLRGALASWPAAVEAAKDYGDRHADFVDSQFLPGLRDVASLHELAEARLSCRRDEVSAHVMLPATEGTANLINHLRLSSLLAGRGVAWTRMTRLLERIQDGLARAGS